ncbi:hypothetical protein [Ktedonobacter sp. SOSP1-52]|uniref:hypothetical protein n=1 Tax=Ktedonobacter sp. SOSP1-52 TaxID=2778366 RepID=UPI0019161AD6|nr:hypothetical protein [Ktedonobacter sp. SOSP1-52]
MLRRFLSAFVEFVRSCSSWQIRIVTLAFLVLSIGCSSQALVSAVAASSHVMQPVSSAANNIDTLVYPHQRACTISPQQVAQRTISQNEPLAGTSSMMPNTCSHIQK